MDHGSVHELDRRPGSADVPPHSLLGRNWALDALHRVRRKQLGGHRCVLDGDGRELGRIAVVFWVIDDEGAAGAPSCDGRRTGV